MAPEYAMDGAFSVKSDTYSFGVILLEIVSGLKISLTHRQDFPNLLAYVSIVSCFKLCLFKQKIAYPITVKLIILFQAWSLWKEGKTMNLLDSSLVENCSSVAVLRCIHIGLLCVQDNPSSRPDMSSIVFMLENESIELSAPKQPVYFSQRYSDAQETGENTSSSTNNMNLTVTVLEGR